MEKELEKKRERHGENTLYFVILPPRKLKREKIIIIFLTNIYGASMAVPCNGKRYLKNHSTAIKHIRCQDGAFNHQLCVGRGVGCLGELCSVYVSVCLCQSLSRVRLFVTPWTAACQAPLSVEFSRQEYWSGLPFPSTGDLPNQEIEPVSLASPALGGRFFTIALPGKQRGKLTY